MRHYGLQWSSILKSLESSLNTDNGSVFTLSKDFQDPYHILIETILSSRTKDRIMYSAAIKLFKRAPNLTALLTVTVEDVSTWRSNKLPCNSFPLVTSIDPAVFGAITKAIKYNNMIRMQHIIQNHQKGRHSCPET